MKCPTPCYLCGRVFELHNLYFHTDYCRCGPFGTCGHGLCAVCNSAFSDCTDGEIVPIKMTRKRKLKLADDSE